MRTILGNEINIEGRDYNEEAVKKANAAFDAAVKRDADVIVTAVMLGFIGTRYHLNQPCQIDFEYPSPGQLKEWEPYYRGEKVGDAPKDYETFVQEIQQFEHVMSAMSLVLDKNEPGLGDWLLDGQSHPWKEGALITGLAGGQMNRAAKRHRELKSGLSKDLAEQIATDPTSFKGAEALYLGKGAYTGMVDDVINNTRFIQRTKRVIDNDKKRWHPGDVNWGLIRPSGSENINLEDLRRGLGPLPATQQEVKRPGRIGYIHGMVSAIVKSVSAGPWCYPYELATGVETTKMASCFACTTYMYATGFPPSSTHIGKGESWIPPKPDLESGEQIEGIQDYFNKLDKAVMSSLITRWHWDIYNYLRLGTKYLLRDDDFVNNDHAVIVKKLDSTLQGYKSEDIGQQGGNLYLDALTVHESDWRRVMRTLQPIYDHYNNPKV